MANSQIGELIGCKVGRSVKRLLVDAQLARIVIAEHYNVQPLLNLKHLLLHGRESSLDFLPKEIKLENEKKNRSIKNPRRLQRIEVL